MLNMSAGAISSSSSSSASSANASASSSAAVHIVIVGGGVMGCSAAFHLVRLLQQREAGQQTEVTLLERTSIACAASGKAGGFLAESWCDRTPSKHLARRSFQLHCELSEQLQGESKYLFRRVDTFQVDIDEKHSNIQMEDEQEESEQEKAKDKKSDEDESERQSDSGKTKRRKASRNSSRLYDHIRGWVSSKYIPNIDEVMRLGSPSNTAQVHPSLFTHTLFEAAKSSGLKVEIGSCVGIECATEENKSKDKQSEKSEQKKIVKKVEILRNDGSKDSIRCDVLILCNSVWGDQLRHCFPHFPRISATKAHSIILRPTSSSSASSSAIGAQCLFLSYHCADGSQLDPEIYPRSNGDVYMCGVNEEDCTVPDSASAVVPTPGACARLKGFCAHVSTLLGSSAECSTEQACFLPCGDDGSPLIGRYSVDGHDNVYVANGLSCWGILNSPAAGEALAELILMGNSKKIDLKPFSPDRFGKWNVDD